MIWRPKPLAQKYNLSANTIRNYESRGLIPPSKRSANGYRSYTAEHEVYVACVQAMAPAFGMEVTSEVMHRIQQGEVDDALWLVKSKEISLYQEKARLDQLIQELKANIDGYTPSTHSQRFNIEEASARTGASKSAIRYWEKAGLIAVTRDPANHYRQYYEAHLLKIKLIQVLHNFIYSEETVRIKQRLSETNHHDLEQLMRIALEMRSLLQLTNEAISLLLHCETQEQIDYYWEQLSAVPEAEQCGWLKDKYGVSWQISPAVLDEMLIKGTPEQRARVT